MFPDLLCIGPLTIHTYGLFVATGFLVGLIVTIIIGKSEGISQQQVMDMGFIIVLSAIIGSRIMYALMNISHYRHHPLDIFKVWQGGLVFSGGIIAGILVLIWYTRKSHLSLWKTCDMLAPGLALGQGIGRIGCFMAGCCYGKPTDLIWGVKFTHPNSLAPLNIPLHPTQIYSSISAIIIFLVLLLLHSKKSFAGQVFLWFLILHSTARLAIEQFRGDDRGILLNSNMSFTQFIAIIIFIAAVITLNIVKSKKGSSSHP